MKKYVCMGLFLLGSWDLVLAQTTTRSTAQPTTTANPTRVRRVPSESSSTPATAPNATRRPPSESSGTPTTAPNATRRPGTEEYNQPENVGIVPSTAPDAIMVTSNELPSIANDVNPIDNNLDVCLGRDSSTAGMIRCLDQAYRAWDGEMNRVYNALMGKLRPEDQNMLRTLQRQWVNMRDAEHNWINAYFPKDSPKWVPIRMSHRVELIKARTLQLKGYLEALEDMR